MNKKFIWLIVSCLIVAVLVLSSCAKEVTPTTPTTPAAPTTPEEKVVEKVGPQYGGILYWSPYWDEIPSFDWSDNIWQTENLQNYTHDTLMRGDWYVDRDLENWRFMWSSRNNEQYWMGALAESWETPDPLTYVFHLRKGVRWQNKPPMTDREFVANDVVLQFERLQASPRFTGRSVKESIASVTAPDKYTVVFKVKEPYYGLLSDVSIINIEPHDLWEEYGDLRDWTRCIGTGPFMLEDYVVGGSLTFKRNPDYWEKDPRNGNQLPYVDGVKLLFIPDASTKLAALRTAKLDANCRISWLNKASLEATAPELQWATNPDSSSYNMFLNNTVPPFDNLKVRQALSMAIDFEKIANTVLPGVGRTLQWPAPDAFAGAYSTFDELPPGAKKVLTCDPVAAKALLAEAGYPNGFKTTAQYCAEAVWAFGEDALLMVKNYWSVIGVNLELKRIDAATASAFRVATAAPKYEIYADSTGQMNPYSTLQTHTTGLSWTGYSNPVVDEVYAKVRSEFDVGKRNAMYKGAFQYLIEQCVSIGLPQGATYSAWWPWVKEWAGEGHLPKDYGQVHAHIWLDQDLREEMTGRR